CWIRGSTRLRPGVAVQVDVGLRSGTPDNEASRRKAVYPGSGVHPGAAGGARRSGRASARSAEHTVRTPRLPHPASGGRIWRVCTVRGARHQNPRLAHVLVATQCDTGRTEPDGLMMLCDAVLLQESGAGRLNIGGHIDVVPAV